MSQSVQFIPLGAIKSPWYDDIVSQWRPDMSYIEFLKNNISQNAYVAPVIVVREKEHFLIVNGHHRYYAHLALGARQVKCIVLESTFEQSEPLRKAEVMLKDFDRQTGYRYQFSSYLDRWAAAAEDHEFVNRYRPTFRSRVRRFVRFLRGALWGRK